MFASGYAARAFSTVDNENANGILNHLDHRGVQTSSVEEVTRHMSNLQRLQLLRKSSVGRYVYDSRDLFSYPRQYIFLIIY